MTAAYQTLIFLPMPILSIHQEKNLYLKYVKNDNGKPFIIKLLKQIKTQRI